MKSGDGLRAISILSLTLSILLGSAGVRAQEVEKAQCAEAYEKAQENRVNGRLLAARDELVICAQQGCPAFVQSDCAQWLIEVEREMPSIVVAAKDESGSDTVDVRVIVDDELLVEELDGGAINVDPGLHTFRFEIEGAEPIERKILIRQAQKNRVVEVSWAPEEPAEPLDAGESPYEGMIDEDEEPGREQPAKPGPLRPYAYVAGGVGGAGLIGFAVLGLVGKNQGDACKPTCTESEVDSVETKFLLADISLGVGIAGVAAGVALFILSMPKKDQPSAGDAGLSLGVRPTSKGAFATVSGGF